jgi:hypothetical protein
VDAFLWVGGYPSADQGRGESHPRVDGDRSVGRIYKEHGEAKWFLSVNFSPYPAPPPNNGLAMSLKEAKQQFKQRYEEMKAQGVRPFA